VFKKFFRQVPMFLHQFKGKKARVRVEQQGGLGWGLGWQRMQAVPSLNRTARECQAGMDERSHQRKTPHS